LIRYNKENSVPGFPNAMACYCNTPAIFFFWIPLVEDCTDVDFRRAESVVAGVLLAGFASRSG
jgi:hypothetical protein